MTECSSGLLLWNGKCEDTCPVGTYLSGPVECMKCHYTCLQCIGSTDYQCTACYSDADLHSSTIGSYCYPKSLNEMINYTKWYFWTCIILGINIVLIVVIMMVCFQKRILAKNYPKKSPFIESVKYKLAGNESDSDN